MRNVGLIVYEYTLVIIFNQGKQDAKKDKITIKVGNENITQERNAKLLGVTIDDNQKWHTQIYGKGGLLSSLNTRLFMIRRLRNALNKESIIKIADSLYTSKLRYGLALYGKIRWNEVDIKTQEF